MASLIFPGSSQTASEGPSWPGALSRPAGRLKTHFLCPMAEGTSPPQVEKHRSLTRRVEERRAACLMERVLMRPDSPTEKTPPLPICLHFRTTALEGVTASCTPLSQNHKP